MLCLQLSTHAFKIQSPNTEVKVSALRIALAAELELLQKMLVDLIRRYGFGENHVIVKSARTFDFDTLNWPPNDHLNWPPEDKTI